MWDDTNVDYNLLRVQDACDFTKKVLQGIVYDYNAV